MGRHLRPEAPEPRDHRGRPVAREPERPAWPEWGDQRIQGTKDGAPAGGSTSWRAAYPDLRPI